ncbi:MAG TPA: hypothetical protein VNL73_09490 [Verrucomicrobiae bacterium]|nr:hypothetical protein [Verrucomicrobiae bacterium]
MTKRNRLQTPLGFLLFLFLTPGAFPQSPWLDQTADRAIFLEIQKPNFTDEYLGGGFLTPPLKTTFSTATFFLSGRFRLGRLLTLKAELPFTNAGLKDYTFIDFFGDTVSVEGYSENQLGNPQIGVEIAPPGSRFAADFAVRFPIVDDEHLLASEFAFFTDYDRFEAFFPDVMTFTAGANYRYTGPTGLLINLRAGPAFMVVTEGGGDAQLFGDYGAQVGFRSGRVTLLGGFTGRALITEGDLSFNERTIQQLGLSGSYAFGNFIPGLLFRVPMDDDLGDILDFVFGVSVGYRLP